MEPVVSTVPLGPPPAVIHFTPTGEPVAGAVGALPAVMVVPVEGVPIGGVSAGEAAAIAEAAVTAARHTHHQDVPAAVWTIVHALGYRPSVTVIDSAGDAVLAHVAHADTHTVTVTHAAAVGGIAYLV